LPEDFVKNTYSHFYLIMFNILEKILQLALKGHITEIKVNGIPINNLWYANNIAILAQNIQKLQTTLYAINEIGKEYVLNNVKQTKLMIADIPIKM